MGQMICDHFLSQAHTFTYDTQQPLRSGVGRKIIMADWRVVVGYPLFIGLLANAGNSEQMS
jgi:hypothetical protein